MLGFWASCCCIWLRSGRPKPSNPDPLPSLLLPPRPGKSELPKSAMPIPSLHSDHHSQRQKLYWQRKSHQEVEFCGFKPWTKWIVWYDRKISWIWTLYNLFLITSGTARTNKIVELMDLQPHPYKQMFLKTQTVHPGCKGKKTNWHPDSLSNG